jgi:hypothetical protein
LDGCPPDGDQEKSTSPEKRARVDTGEPPLPDIKWSSPSVRRASEALDRGETSVTVKSRAEAEEIFLGRYVGEGYRNAEEFNSVTAKKHFRKTKEPEGYYHWDDTPISNTKTRKVTMANHDPTDSHGDHPHLQLHPTEGEAIRIYWQNPYENQK